MGREAHAWLARRNLVVLNHRDTVRVFADSLRSRDIGVARVWSSAVDLRIESSADAVTVLTVIDGAFTLEAGAEVVDVGASLLLPPSHGVSASIESTAAWVEVTLHRTKWERARLPARNRTVAPVPGSGVSRILTGLANALLASQVDIVDVGWRHLGRAVEEALLAFLWERSGISEPTGASSAEARLFARALAVIDESADRPEFSVSELVSLLNSSSTRVSNAFSAHGTTAQHEIREARGAWASELLSHRRATSADELEWIAHRSGFGTVQTMLRSVRASRARGSRRSRDSRGDR